MRGSLGGLLCCKYVDAFLQFQLNFKTSFLWRRAQPHPTCPTQHTGTVSSPKAREGFCLINTLLQPFPPLGVGIDDPWRSLATQIILWFFDSHPITTSSHWCHRSDKAPGLQPLSHHKAFLGTPAALLPFLRVWHHGRSSQTNNYPHFY